MTNQQPAADLQPLTPAATPAPPPPVQPGLPVAIEQVPPPPSTGLELGQLRARRAQLSEQLQSATNRREQIARELRNPMVEGADRAGLEQRLRLLDQRILRLEADIAISGQQLASAPGRLVASARVSETFGGLPAGGVVAIGIVGTVTVLAPLAFAAARLMWRRARYTPLPPSSAPSWENSPRLDRLEQAVDAIAVELERVSEGQRFVTRLLAESHGASANGDGGHTVPAALPPGAPARPA